MGDGVGVGVGSGDGSGVAVGPGTGVGIVINICSDESAYDIEQIQSKTNNNKDANKYSFLYKI